MTENPVESEPVEQIPVGFWTDLAASIRKELRPPVSGFFAPTPNAPVQAKLTGDTLTLHCANDFTRGMVDKPNVTELVARKATAQLGRSIRVRVVDATAKPDNRHMEQLLNFGRAHSDIVKIKE